MSPQVSQPRRRLPTGMNSTSGAWLCRYVTRSAAVAAVSVSRCRPSSFARSSIALRICASFFAPIPLSDRRRPVLARRRPGRRASRCSASSRASPPSSARRPADGADRGSSAGTPRAAPGDTADVPVSASSRIFAARSLPTPGIVRSCCASMRATASGQVAMTSAAERYARILNAFSPLISSRSAICAKHLRDRLVIHARARGARTCSRAAARLRRPGPPAIASRAAGGP